MLFLYFKIIMAEDKDVNVDIPEDTLESLMNDDADVEDEPQVIEEEKLSEETLNELLEKLRTMDPASRNAVLQGMPNLNSTGQTFNEMSKKNFAKMRLKQKIREMRMGRSSKQVRESYIAKMEEKQKNSLNAQANTTSTLTDAQRERRARKNKKKKERRRAKKQAGVENNNSEDTSETPVEESVENSVEATVENSVEATVEATVEESVEATVEATVEESVEATVEAPVEESVEATVEAPVEESVEATVEATVEEQVDTVEKTVVAPATA